MDNIKQILNNIKNNNCNSEKCIEEKNMLNYLINQYNLQNEENEISINNFGKYIKIHIDDEFNLKTNNVYFYKNR